jgi:hypothetical protein
MSRVLLKCTLDSVLGNLLSGYDIAITKGAMLDLVDHFQLTPAFHNLNTNL